MTAVTRRLTITILLALLVFRVAPAAAQIEYYATLGASYSTPLVKDEIFVPIETQQGIAPTLTLGAALPAGPRYSVGLELALGTGSFDAESNGSSTDLGTVRTATITAGLNGPVLAGLRWRAGGGLVSYLPSEDQGIFLRGGPTQLLAAFGVEYRVPWRGRWTILTAARYDFHRFTTEELESRGFSRSQEVHRVALSLGLLRAHR